MDQMETKKALPDAASTAQSADTPATALPERPALAEGVQLIGQFDSAGFRDPQWLVMRDGRFIQVTEVLFRLLEQADGTRSLDDMASHVSVAIDRVVSRENVEHLLRMKLLPMGLVAGADGRAEPTTPESEFLRSPMHVNFRFKVAGHRVEPIARVLTFLHTPVAMVPLLVAVALVHGWLYGVHGAAGLLKHLIANPDLALIVLPVMLGASVFHEFGHASALLYEGGRVRGIGGGFVLVFPALYTDVTDGYRLSRSARLRIDLAGPYFHLLFGLALAGLYLLTGETYWLVLILLTDIEVGRQFLPIGRLDGYWALADLSGIPDFFSRLVPFVASLLPIQVPDTMRLPELTPRARRVFLTYLLALLIGVPAFLVYVLARLPGILETGSEAFLTQVEILRVSVRVGDTLTAVGSALQVAFLALGAVALGLFLYLITWRPAKKVWAWSRTQHRFLRRTTRGALLVAAGAMLAIFGSLYPWRVFEASGLGLSRQFGGMEWVAGRATLVGGILATVAAGVMFLSWNLRLRRIAGAVALGFGLAGTSLAIVKTVRAGGLTDEWIRDTIQASLGAAPTPSEFEVVREQVAAIGFSVMEGYGPLLVGLGGLLAAAGGAIALMTRTPSVESLRETYADLGAAPPAPDRPKPRHALRRLAAGIAVVAVAIGGAFIAFGMPRDDPDPQPPAQTSSASDLALWSPGRSGLRDRLTALGLPILSEEALGYHVHQHLDVFVEGIKIRIPGGIGIDPDKGFLTVLHTHGPDGVIHVEAPHHRTFTLGQFFRVWGVELTSRCLGTSCGEGDERVRVFVNGLAARGDPRDIVLRKHAEIVVAFGSPDELPKPVPSRFHFPAGL